MAAQRPPKYRSRRPALSHPAMLREGVPALGLAGSMARVFIESPLSLLPMVAFAKNEVHRDSSVRKAVILAGQIRMRPIRVTDLTMTAGAVAILFDPIFQGMAISLLFGPIVATSLTLIVVPLGCISVGRAFCVDQDGASGTADS